MNTFETCKLDPTKCNKIALTLASNLDKNYTKIQMEQFSNSILVGKEIKDYAKPRNLWKKDWNK